MLKVKSNVKIPDSGKDLIQYIKDHHVPMEYVAQNLVSEENPNGMHARWLRVLIQRGLSNSDKRAVKTVVDKLSHQKQMKGESKNA